MLKCGLCRTNSNRTTLYFIIASQLYSDNCIEGLRRKEAVSTGFTLATSCCTPNTPKSFDTRDSLLEFSRIPLICPGDITSDESEETRG